MQLTNEVWYEEVHILVGCLSGNFMSLTGVYVGDWSRVLPFDVTTGISRFLRH